MPVGEEDAEANFAQFTRVLMQLRQIGMSGGFEVMRKQAKLSKEAKRVAAVWDFTGLSIRKSPRTSELGRHGPTDLVKRRNRLGGKAKGTSSEINIRAETGCRLRKGPKTQHRPLHIALQHREIPLLDTRRDWAILALSQKRLLELDCLPLRVPH